METDPKKKSRQPEDAVAKGSTLCKIKHDRPIPFSTGKAIKITKNVIAAPYAHSTLAKGSARQLSTLVKGGAKELEKGCKSGKRKASYAEDTISTASANNITGLADLQPIAFERCETLSRVKKQKRGEKCDPPPSGSSLERSLDPPIKNDRNWKDERRIKKRKQEATSKKVATSTSTHHPNKFSQSAALISTNVVPRQKGYTSVFPVSRQMQPKARVAIADLVSKSNERSRSLEGNIAFKVKAFLSRQEVTSTENGQADSDILKTHAVKKVETKKEQNEREKGRRKKNLEMTAPSVISSRDGGQASEGIGLAAYSTSGPITPKILKPPTKRIKATASTPAKASIATSTSHQRTHPMTDTNVKEAKIKAAASTPAKASIVASTLHQRTHPMTDTNMKAAFDKRPVEGMASPPQQLIQEKPKTTLSSIKAELHTKEELQQVKVNATEVIPPKAPLKKQHRDYNIDGSQRQFSGKPIAVPTTRSESNTEDCIVKYAFCPTSPPEYANVGELDAVDQRRLTLVQGIVSPPKRPMQGKPNIALSSIKSELRTRKELQDELTTPVIPPGTASKKQVRDYNVNGCQRQIPGKPISIPTTRSESDTEDCVVKYVSLPPTSPIFEIDKHSVKYSVPTLGGSWTPKEWILSRGAELEEEGSNLEKGQYDFSTRMNEPGIPVKSEKREKKMKRKYKTKKDLIERETLMKVGKSMKDANQTEMRPKKKEKNDFLKDDTLIEVSRDRNMEETNQGPLTKDELSRVDQSILDLAQLLSMDKTKFWVRASHISMEDLRLPTSRPAFSISPASGDIVVMDGRSIQQNYEHAIARVDGVRMSVSLRTVGTEPSFRDLLGTSFGLPD